MLADSKATEEQAIDRAARRHYERIAQLALFPNDFDNFEHTIDRDQTIAVAKSPLGKLLQRLARCAAGPAVVRGDYLMELAVRFFTANGMRYRFPLAQKPSFEARTNQTQAERELTFLSRLRLWVPPQSALMNGTEGANSLHWINKDELAAVATEFFKTDIRCIWFERMLAEAIIGAEVYALGESLKSNPALWGRQSFIWSMLVSTAYEFSKGASPKYEISVWVARIAHTLAKLAVIFVLAWYAALLIDDDKPIRGYLIGALAAYGAVNIVGQFVVSRIVAWIRGASGDGLAALRGFSAYGILISAQMAYGQIAHENMNPRAARDLLFACTVKGFVVDPIVFCLLDRSIANNDHRWPSHHDAPPAEDFLLDWEEG